MKYRSEVDGLRALAVLPVILFHAGFSAFSGGFVGVDVFFVISGYLISSQILLEKEAREFSLIKFYERRARRILPALFFVIFATLPFVYLWFLPSDMKDFGQSLVSVMFFASNFLFWKETGYFVALGEWKPLVHTWSLAIEEQFYLFFPLLLLLVWRKGRSGLVVAFTGLFVLSFAYAQWGSVHRPTDAFYLLPARAWEFLIGAFCAQYSLYGIEKKIGFTRAVKEFLGLAGVGLIVYSIFAFNSTTPFPGIYALAPTVGAALIILFSSPETFAGRILGCKPFAGIGLLSYSAYLWHQPLFSLARHYSLTPLGPQAFIVLSLAALILAYFSWRFVETPLRKPGWVRRKHFFISAAGVSAVFVLLGLGGHFYSHRLGALPPNVLWQSLGEKLYFKGEACDPTPLKENPQIEACFFGDLNATLTIALYGDSHAQAIQEELGNGFFEQGIRGMRVLLPTCEPIPRTFRKITGGKLNIENCQKDWKVFLSFLEKNVEGIVVSIYWKKRIHPVIDWVDVLDATEVERTQKRSLSAEYMALGADGKIGEGMREKKAALADLVATLLATKKRVVLLYPVPRARGNIAKLNVRHYRQSGQLLSQISIPYEDFLKSNRFVNQVFDSLAPRPNLIKVSPEKIFCNTFVSGQCVAQFDTVPFYYDNDHLSDAGAKLVVKEVITHLRLSRQ